MKNIMQLFSRSIFFKIAKEAGLDIYVGRGRKREIDRKKVQDLFKVYTNRNLERILKKKPFIFAVSRHPFQRLVSAFLNFKERPSTRMAKGSFTSFLTSSVLKNNNHILYLIAVCWPLILGTSILKPALKGK